MQTLQFGCLLMREATIMILRKSERFAFCVRQAVRRRGKAGQIAGEYFRLATALSALAASAPNYGSVSCGVSVDPLMGRRGGAAWLPVRRTNGEAVIELAAR
jgi:hypothetical protein